MPVNIKPTIKSIAKHLGISHATVSMALRDHPLVHEETKKRVKAAASQLGYVPNGIAQAMRQSKTKTLGVIVGNMSLSFTSIIVQAIEQEAKKRGYQCLLCQSHDSSVELEKEIRVLTEQRAAGLIIQALNFENQAEVYNRALPSNMPRVFCDGEVPGCPAGAVLSNSHYVGFLATRHLLSLGHRQIACLQGPERSQNAQDRFRGYCSALKRASVKVDPRLVVSGGWEFGEGRLAAETLLSRKVRFTALVASSDAVAVGAMKTLIEAGLRIPQDVSVIGAGNTDFAELVTPSLTSMEQHPRAIGKKSVELLFKQIASPGEHLTRHTVRPDLVVRESTAPCRA